MITNKESLESFIMFCNNMEIAEEGKIIEKIKKKIVQINFFGTKAKVRIIPSSTGEIPDESILNIICTNKSLYDYLYKEYKKMFDEINKDPYYEGRTISKGEDLIEAIREECHRGFELRVRDNVTFFCGEYWCDEEHGFSISFPNGKFVRKTGTRGQYDEHWNIVGTGLGQFSDGY